MAVLDRIAAGNTVYVPVVWPLEVTNALVRALRRRRISREELGDYSRQLAELHVNIDPESAGRAFGDILPLAERYQLTTYDASYLELAHRLDLPLATADANLIQSAARVTVAIFRTQP